MSTKNAYEGHNRKILTIKIAMISVLVLKYSILHSIYYYDY